MNIPASLSRFPGSCFSSASGGVAILPAPAAITGEKHVEQLPERLYGVDDPQFRHDMSVLLGPPLVEGNHIGVLLNGDRIFSAMLAAIREARLTLTFETFIYWSDSIGEEFAEALAARARAGVRVHVLLDWLGSVKIEQRYIDRMKDAGVEVVRFHEPHRTGPNRMNNRTHRKVLVIDGSIGFTGGVGIADQWRGDAEDEAHWRDTHFRVTGPVVAQIQAVFIDNWTKATGTVLHGADYFPALEPQGTLPAQMFMSSPSGGSESMQLMYMMALTSASRSIDLSSSYFVPDAMAVTALTDAAKRGVRVRIITPGKKIDATIVRRASRARWGPLLEAGISIAEYQPTMFHCKVMVIDEYLVSVGSTNFDNRSFRLNDEANLNVFDKTFARQQTQIFETDMQRAKQITLDAWRKRPLQEKLLEHAAALFGKLL